MFSEMIFMEKTATLNLRVSPSVKQQAERVLSSLGVSMATAIDIYLRQIALAGGIPFPVRIPPVPENMNADSMDTETLRHTLIKGMDDAETEALSGEIATKIQNEMTYPGQVKITVIRETRSVAYAK